MVGLGDLTYSKESSENAYGTKNILEFSKTKWGTILTDKGKSLNAVLQKSFQQPHFNPYPGFTGQGYHGDLNLENNTMFKMARAYLWLQRDGLVPSDYDHTHVTMLRTEGAEKYTTFIFREKEIQAYFKEHPEQLKGDIPLYDYQTDNKITNE